MRVAVPAVLFATIVVLAASPVLADEKGTEVKIGHLVATTPANWKKEKPANLLRSYQFKLPGDKDQPAPELAIFPESNPDPAKSFPKWKAQFVPPEGKTTDDLCKTGKWELKGATVTYLDVSGGTWKFKERPQDPKSKQMFLDNYRVIWVIVAEKDEATQIRLSGPAESVDKQFKVFESFVKSLK